MAEIIDDDTGQQARNIAARHPLRMGAAAAATIFATGFIAGHKRAESQSAYHKLMRRVSNLK